MPSPQCLGRPAVPGRPVLYPSQKQGTFLSFPLSSSCSFSPAFSRGTNQGHPFPCLAKRLVLIQELVSEDIQKGCQRTSGCGDVSAHNLRAPATLFPVEHMNLRPQRSLLKHASLSLARNYGTPYAPGCKAHRWVMMRHRTLHRSQQ